MENLTLFWSDLFLINPVHSSQDNSPLLLRHVVFNAFTNFRLRAVVRQGSDLAKAKLICIKISKFVITVLVTHLPLDFESFVVK